MSYQLLVESDGQGRNRSQSGHFVPLPGPYGLLDGMQIEFGQPFQLVQGFRRSKSPVGIHPEFHLASRKMPTDETQQVQFLLETDGTDFQLDTTEAGFQLFP